MAQGQTTGDRPTTQPEEAPIKPPLPKFLYRILNPLLVAVLRSRFHSRISGSLMALTFRGRKSGKQYRIPVGYLQQGNRIFVFSHSAWSKNFRGGAPVSVRVRGQELRGAASIMEDPAEIAPVVAAMVAKNGEAMARRMGVLGETPDSPRRGTVFVQIDLEGV